MRRTMRILVGIFVVLFDAAQGWTAMTPNNLLKRSSSSVTTRNKRLSSSSLAIPLLLLRAASTNQEPPKNDDEEEDDDEMMKKRKALEQAAAEFKRQQQQQKQKQQQQPTKINNKLIDEDDDDDDDDQQQAEEEEGLLDKLNPFKAGQKLRQTLDSALSTLGSTTAGISSERRSVYYLEDHFSGDSALLFAERNPSLERWLQQQRNSQDFVPEVLVVGATGDIGPLVVRRLLLEANCRVRVLVQDLYSKTLNLLGTGVTYCQGDLNNMDSLEYAVTDVDKIIFCATAPRTDEPDFQTKFQSYCQETLKDENGGMECAILDPDASSSWENVESVLGLRAKLAEQVDMIGLQNVVRAYLNVRHADYGTSQAAKRSLFKFQDRPEDFNLFAIDDDDDDINEEDTSLLMASAGSSAVSTTTVGAVGGSSTSTTATTMAKPKIATAPAANFDPYATVPTEDEWKDDYAMPEDDDYYARMNKQFSEQDPYADYYGDDPTSASGAATTSTTTTIEQRRDAAYKATCQWIRNAFGHGVFVGKVPKATASGGGESAIVSSRLRASRGDPDSDQGIDLGTGFAGFVCRVCSDGGNYEAFIRTGLYETDGIEYVCEFNTITKPTQKWNKSPNKFKTIRLDFENFTPVQRKKKMGSVRDAASIPPFGGKDIRRIGFRYRSAANPDQSPSSSSSYFNAKTEKSGTASAAWSNFYLALCYIKVYRSQPEPEFVYLSDARIPPVVKNGMVRHDARQIVSSVDDAEGGESVYRIFDEATLESVLVKSNKNERTPEETYYKFRGEEILKNSGISYSIVRIWGLNDSPSGEASSLELASSNEDLSYVSRAEVAQVCARALVDPNALNKSFYISKTKRSSSAAAAADVADLLSAKFAALPPDANP